MILHADCVEAMRGMSENSIDAIVTDPPYHLSFMGRSWDKASPTDSQAMHEVWAREGLRLLKPGGHLLAFGGTRTYHRLACGIEDAGFEIRDSLMWIHGQGFPKSKNVALLIDKAAGHPNRGRAIPAASTHFPTGRYVEEKLTSNPVEEYEARTAEGEAWKGWGTALKPAHEPIVMARKPLSGTTVKNVLAHGVGPINVDGCRVGSEERVNTPAGNKPGEGSALYMSDYGMPTDTTGRTVRGRWPANVILDEAAAIELDAQSGSGRSRKGKPRVGVKGDGWGMSATGAEYDDRGGASRFFYCAKAGRKERGADNKHPTVKPLALMRWLVRLVTPPGGLVLDPFAGSGTTGLAAIREGFEFIGIEREPDYVATARSRISQVLVRS
jgi:site-specific DNA-methyltransferase (adenine-specific)